MTLPTDRPLVLDGGLATLLERLGHDLSGSLWSAAVLQTDPGAIVDAHAAFFAAGADVATTATYQLTPMSLAGAGVDPSAFPGLVRIAVDAARSARDGAGHGWVVGSVGPYGASLANGSEYTGAYGIGHGQAAVRTLRVHHRPRLEALLEAGVDALACETIPTLIEVEAIGVELDELGAGVPAWFSVTPAPGGWTTRTGEPLAEVRQGVESIEAAFAVGVNCCPPADVAPALEALHADGGRLTGVAYPNSGEEWDAVARCWRGRARWADDAVASWRRAGACLVGGCCRVFPEQIRDAAGQLGAARGSGASPTTPGRG